MTVDYASGTYKAYLQAAFCNLPEACATAGLLHYARNLLNTLQNVCMEGLM